MVYVGRSRNAAMNESSNGMGWKWNARSVRSVTRTQALISCREIKMWERKLFLFSWVVGGGAAAVGVAFSTGRLRDRKENSLTWPNEAGAT